ncbi:S41 family peptidase [Pedobacter sp. PLR]|uniref:S41 family peptidase n=1 Tax=Pedobacter sp. PLR TaxID=2994465 RepID=UPI00224562E3|nr:S41 family peptidase [Pedobacter sp. PLR]MCX2449772.1 S41 family peptidase [Pedobacter sp. PLR]
MKTPNLILDLRNNGGGADFAYEPIVPYLYTNPYQVIGSDLLATDDNIKGWMALTGTEGLPANQIASIKKVVKKMEQHKGALFNFYADQSFSLDSVSTYPKKVIILMNQNCGSTTEQFLFFAKQSAKVTLMGDRTRGVLDYSNMRSAEFGCMPYMLYWATTRSRRVDAGQAIDNVGIQPSVTLGNDENWLERAKRYAEEGSK